MPPAAERERDTRLIALLVERGHLDPEDARSASSAGDIAYEALRALSDRKLLEIGLEELLDSDLPLDLADRLRDWCQRSEEFLLGTVRVRGGDTILPEEVGLDQRESAQTVLPVESAEIVSPLESLPTTPPAARALADAPTGPVPARKRPAPPVLPEWLQDRGLLGKGGMGEVREALDRDLGRTVAVKLATDMDEDATRRFLAELRATARLEHPNILPVYTAGLDAAGRLFYVMKKVEGRTLWGAMEGGGNLRDSIRSLAVAARAVDHAHRQGFLHRDLKPDNIMVGDHGEVWVVDWGLVRGEAALSAIGRADLPLSRLTITGYMMGTLGYAAPEQLEGTPKAIGPAADVHGLGATLYEILTGRRPYDGKTSHEVLVQYARSKPVRPDFPSPPELASAAMRALAKKPAERHPTAAAFAEDLEAWLTGRRVPSHDYSRLARAGFWIRAHPVLAAALSVAFLAAVGLGLLRANRARLEAAASESLAVEKAKTIEERVSRSLPEIEPALAEARSAHDERLAALAAYSVPYLKVWTNSAEAGETLEPLGPPNPGGDPAVAAADRRWRVASATLSTHLDSLERAVAEARDQGLDPPAAAAALEPDAIRTELRFQELAWTLERARFLEDATIDTRSLEALRRTAFLDPDLPGLSPLYTEPVSLERELEARFGPDHPALARARRVLFARATLAIGPLPEEANHAQLIEFVTAENPFGRRVVDPDLPRAGKTYDLPMGSYVLEVRTGPRPEDLVAFPVLLERDREARIDVELPAEIPAGFVYVPPGRFIGGGEGLFALPRHWCRVERGLFMARYETTFAEYLPFLAHVRENEPERAKQMEPMQLDDYHEGWKAVVGPDLELLDPARAGPDFPVYGITQEAALKYAAWRSKQDPRHAYTLPTEEQWVYAARGADGRTYVWGDALPGPLDPRPHSVGSWLVDRSVFGVLDLAYSVGEWTARRTGETVAVPGGSAAAGELLVQCSSRHLLLITLRSIAVGTRVVVVSPE
ncbi:MAG: protein kinase [Planctomycetes bacterium]|nr:protein kinase [Planctomycetota bacterium]